jgi:hypothetical protein
MNDKVNMIPEACFGENSFQTNIRFMEIDPCLLDMSVQTGTEWVTIMMSR